MKFSLICAAGLLFGTAASRIVADVVAVAPTESYATVRQATGWQPAEKAYSLVNNGFDWVYWQGSNSNGKVVCEPGKGWIAPGASVSVMLYPDASMATANPGTYNEQVNFDFDPRLVGDLDGDGTVDIVDLLTFSSGWGTIAGEAGYDAASDFNGDGVIDIVDLMQLATSWDHTFGGTAI